MGNLVERAQEKESDLKFEFGVKNESSAVSGRASKSQIGQQYAAQKQ